MLREFGSRCTFRVARNFQTRIIKFKITFAQIFLVESKKTRKKCSYFKWNLKISPSWPENFTRFDLNECLPDLTLEIFPLIPMKGVEQSEKERRGVKRRETKRDRERKREKGESSSEGRDREDTIDSLSSERERGIECMRERKRERDNRRRSVVKDWWRT